ncbi:MAG: hypothetical protein KAW12_20570 [Candidatus Aminicenantes bacterium]|nr:hypothetical protein [Candidatus Aminicenantes bacterium]
MSMTIKVQQDTRDTGVFHHPPETGNPGEITGGCVLKPINETYKIIEKNLDRNKRLFVLTFGVTDLLKFWFLVTPGNVCFFRQRGDRLPFPPGRFLRAAYPKNKQKLL